ncbi:unnamed protein product [Leptidea sinapis]|uniref:C2H2-type domain-containing protein n=1 Tax=Leptidea sinapis TaxID=189913 RepID=A0A5E4Q9B9_9NEOP|nr:unnamed protein product [Leptidea sinapis]
MACKASFELYHNFPKLAEEAGFAFNSHRPRVHIEWNKIHCVLESEFDVRILDEGFVKIFRLAQLAVEYQQFCRHYLDRSVHVLRDEVTALVKELDATKRNLREKEEENRRLKKRSTRHSSQNLLPYHNENIATLLLNTIKNQTDLFPSAPHLDALNYNKCNVCDKVFLNQLYLKSHIARRHPNINENNQSEKIPNKDPPINEEDSKLNEEVENLKIKLKEMESLILGSHNSIKGTPEGATNNETAVSKSIDTKIMKDAEVCCTSDEDFILSKIEQWKKEEFEKYNNEISLLRNQITNIIKSNEDKQNQVINKSTNKEIDQLQQTIKQQGVEINLLKQYIENSKSQKEEIEVEKKREIEIQISHWVQRLEEQSNQCKTLMQKLNDMEKEVEKYKAIAGAEKEKFTQLHKLVNQNHSNAQSNISESDKIKIIRAKITEEVNTRLVQLGVDPLRNCLPRSNFVKQRAILQEKQEIKEKVFNDINFQQNNHHKDSSYDEVESLPNTSPRKAYSEENIYNPKQTKGVLKLASSTSSLNKKKVLFDMDAIQMKSASVTPSQSLTEKSDDANEKYTLGLINLDTEEWDISSIENENHKEKANIDVTPRAHPKVAELKEIIESQMARRSLTSTALAGSVNVLPTPMARTSLGGSNTSLGSSILDESENLPAASAPVVPRNAFKNAGKHSERDDSDIDLSELLNDDKF